MTDPTTHPAYLIVTAAIFESLATPEMRAARDAALSAVPLTVPSERPPAKPSRERYGNITNAALDYVAANPGCTWTEIALACGKGTVALDRLTNTGRLRRERTGPPTKSGASFGKPTWRYFPVEVR
jgi:hypothetical protein